MHDNACKAYVSMLPCFFQTAFYDRQRFEAVCTKTFSSCILVNMKIRIQKPEIRRILGGRHEDLHNEILGMDLSGRAIAPIYRHVYYVSYQDLTGWYMFQNGAPALCDYKNGYIYCYHDLHLPLTEVRLVHEFLHRAARFPCAIGVWSSGVEINGRWSRINEALTEYFTSLLCGPRYEEQVSRANRYLVYLPSVRRVEKEIGRQALLHAYFHHDVDILRDHVTKAGESEWFRFK